MWRRPTDVEADRSASATTLQPLDIVVVNTAAGAALRQARLHPAGCGMGREATLYLTSSAACA